MLNLKLYRRAIGAVAECLAIDESNVKALYRRSLAYEAVKEYESALRDMLAVVKLGGGPGLDAASMEKRCEALHEKQLAENKAVNDFVNIHGSVLEMKDKFEQVLDKYDLGDGEAAPLVARWLTEDKDMAQSVQRVVKAWSMSEAEAEHFAKWIRYGLDMKIIPVPAEN